MKMTTGNNKKIRSTTTSCSTCAYQFLIARKIKSSIYQYEINGGVAQLVRARDS